MTEDLVPRLERYLRDIKYQKIHYRKGRKRRKGDLIRMAKTKEPKRKRVCDVVGGGEPFYPDAVKMPLDEVIKLGDVLIRDARIIEDFETDYGKHDLALIAFSNLEGDGEEISTCACSGIVVVKKIKALLEEHFLPIIGSFVKNERYYDLL